MPDFYEFENGKKIAGGITLANKKEYSKKQISEAIEDDRTYEIIKWHMYCKAFESLAHTGGMAEQRYALIKCLFSIKLAEADIEANLK